MKQQWAAFCFLLLLSSSSVLSVAATIQEAHPHHFEHQRQDPPSSAGALAARLRALVAARVAGGDEDAREFEPLIDTLSFLQMEAETQAKTQTQADPLSIMATYGIVVAISTAITRVATKVMTVYLRKKLSAQAKAVAHVIRAYKQSIADRGAIMAKHLKELSFWSLEMLESVRKAENVRANRARDAAPADGSVYQRLHGLINGMPCGNPNEECQGAAEQSLEAAAERAAQAQEHEMREQASAREQLEELGGDIATGHGVWNAIKGDSPALDTILQAAGGQEAMFWQVAKLAMIDAASLVVSTAFIQAYATIGFIEQTLEFIDVVNEAGVVNDAFPMRMLEADYDLRWAQCEVYGSWVHFQNIQAKLITEHIVPHIDEYDVEVRANLEHVRDHMADLHVFVNKVFKGQVPTKVSYIDEAKAAVEQIRFVGHGKATVLRALDGLKEVRSCEVYRVGYRHVEVEADAAVRVEALRDAAHLADDAEEPLDEEELDEPELGAELENMLDVLDADIAERAAERAAELQADIETNTPITRFVVVHLKADHERNKFKTWADALGFKFVEIHTSKKQKFGSVYIGFSKRPYAKKEAAEESALDRIKRESLNPDDAMHRLRVFQGGCSTLTTRQVKAKFADLTKDQLNNAGQPPLAQRASTVNVPTIQWHGTPDEGWFVGANLPTFAKKRKVRKSIATFTHCHISRGAQIIRVGIAARDDERYASAEHCFHSAHPVLPAKKLFKDRKPMYLWYCKQFHNVLPETMAHATLNPFSHTYDALAMATMARLGSEESLQARVERVKGNAKAKKPQQVLQP